MTTPLDIITIALKDAGALGVGQSALDEDFNDAFTKLNWMIAEWARKRWLIWHLVDYSIVSDGSVSYTVGPLGDIAMSQRPDRIESAFLRQLVTAAPNQIDFPLELIDAREDYNRISLKQLASFPSYLFYDSAFPLGSIYPWPVPQPTIYEVHISVKEILSAFTGLNQTIVLPPEYMSAIHYNLVKRLLPQYGQPPNPDINGLAKNALETIRGANFQIGRLQVPSGLVRGGIYNPYSDRVN